MINSGCINKGLKSRTRQDISRLSKAYNRLDISPKLMAALTIKDLRVRLNEATGTVKYIGLILSNKNKIRFKN